MLHQRCQGLVARSFVLSVAAPVAYVALIKRAGAGATLWISVALSCAKLGAAVGLKLLDGR